MALTSPYIAKADSIPSFSVQPRGAASCEIDEPNLSDSTNSLRSPRDCRPLQFPDMDEFVEKELWPSLQDALKEDRLRHPEEYREHPNTGHWVGGRRRGM